MSNKKSLFSLIVVALILVLGIGYAVVSSVNVIIGGVANVANSDLKIEITDVEAVSSVDGKEVDFTNTLTDKNLTSDFTLNGMELDETVTITYTITNNEVDVDAALTLAEGVTLTNSNPEHFEVNYQIQDGTTDLVNSDKTMTVILTVKLIQTPIDEADNSTDVEVTFTATPSETEKA